MKIYGWKDTWMDGWVNRWIDRRRDGIMGKRVENKLVEGREKGRADSYCCEFRVSDGGGRRGEKVSRVFRVCLEDASEAR